METNDFRLRFLRCELFDVPKAVVRFLNYLNLAYELFGEVALHRQIGIEDFTRREMRFVKKGFIQLLPYRDRAGRRVMAIMGGLAHAKEDEFLARVSCMHFVLCVCVVWYVVWYVVCYVVWYVVMLCCVLCCCVS